MKKIIIVVFAVMSLLFVGCINKEKKTQENKKESIAANVSVNPIKKGEPVTVSVKRTTACHTFQLACMTAEIANQVPNDEVLVKYLQKMKYKKYDKDLNNVKLVDLGFAFNKGYSYKLFAVGYDKEGTVGVVSQTDFTIPKQDIWGKPNVDCKIIATAPDSMQVSFTPNKDVGGYGLCIFEAGTIQSQFEQHSRMMGFSTIADMIKRFSGKDYKDTQTKTWKDLIPNTSYDFCVQMWDRNGNFLDVQKITAKTAVLGGKGEANVTIDIKDFGGSEDTGYFQIVVYTPNEQAALHRDIIITEEAFNKADMGDKGIIKMLQEEQPQNPYWNQYGIDKAQWNAIPNTTYIACSIARNVDGKWGKLKKVKFTTPSKNKSK